MEVRLKPNYNSCKESRGRQQVKPVISPQPVRWYVWFTGRRLAEAIVPLLLAITAWPAGAGTLTFAYQVSGGPVLAGTLDGTLRADLNTFIVDAVGPVTYGARPGPALPFSDSLDHFTFGTNALPIVTLNGSFMDFIACTSSSCSDGFLFASGDAFSAESRGGVPDYEDGVSFGLVAQVYSATRWNAASIPEPGTLSLGLLSALALFFGRQHHVRRKGWRVSR